MIIAAIAATGAIYVLTVFVLAVALLFLNDWIFHRAPSKEAKAAAGKRFEERLLKPDIRSLEEHFGHALPDCLKAFYTDRELLLRENIEIAGTLSNGDKTIWNIAFFQPADLEQGGLRTMSKSFGNDRAVPGSR